MGRVWNEYAGQQGHDHRRPDLVMSFIKSRLRWAEASVHGTSCTECGLPPNGPVRIVYVPGIPEGTEEFCSCCGRRLWFVIEVVGADQGGRGIGYGTL
jgi:hypothetical protein